MLHRIQIIKAVVDQPIGHRRCHEERTRYIIVTGEFKFEVRLFVFWTVSLSYSLFYHLSHWLSDRSKPLSPRFSDPLYWLPTVPIHCFNKSLAIKGERRSFGERSVNIEDLKKQQIRNSCDQLGSDGWDLISAIWVCLKPGKSSIRRSDRVSTPQSRRLCRVLGVWLMLGYWYRVLITTWLCLASVD